MSFWRWINKMSAGRSHNPRRARPCLESFEDRLLLAATYVWSGGADGLWSDKNAWKVGGVVGVGTPGAADTVLFDGTDNNNSKMDLQTNVSVLKIQGYTGIISLQRQLILDQLIMSSGTIQRDSAWLGGGGTLFDMKVSQGAGSSTFGDSSWTGGNIGNGGTFQFTIGGSAGHTMTFNVGSATSAPTFSGDQWFMSAPDGRSTTVVNWDQGNINMTPKAGAVTLGPQILNVGTFNARSTGTISGPAGKTWLFTNRGDLVQQGSNQFVNGKVQNLGGGKTFKKVGLDGTPGTFAVAAFDQEGGSLEIDSGTFLVNGAFTQSDGDTLAESGTILTVSGADVTLSGGTMEVAGTLDTDGSFLEEGGTLTLEDGALSAEGGLQVQAGATLTGTGSVSATLTNSGEVDVGWQNSENGDTLTVTGPYSQSGGDATVEPGATLDVSGTDVTLSGGTMEVNGTFDGINSFQQTAGAATVGLNGAVTMDEDYTESGGTLAMQGGTLTSSFGIVYVEYPAILSGKGAIQTSVLNSGQVNVGLGGSGTLSVSGNYTQVADDPEYPGETSIGTPGQTTQAVLSVAGVIDIQAGGLGLNDDNDTVAAGGLTIEQGANLVGSGVITADVTNAGSIVVPATGQVKTLTIDGDYSQTDTGSLSLTLSGGVSDMLTVTGQASLGGTLNVDYADGYTLHPGQGVALIDCGSLLGTFASLGVPQGTYVTYPPESGGEIFIRMNT